MTENKDCKMATELCGKQTEENRLAIAKKRACLNKMPAVLLIEKIGSLNLK
jgi:hypothetical protein